jgi:hypothetical protein
MYYSNTPLVDAGFSTATPPYVTTPGGAVPMYSIGAATPFEVHFDIHVAGRNAANRMAAENPANWTVIAKADAMGAGADTDSGPGAVLIVNRGVNEREIQATAHFPAGLPAGTYLLTVVATNVALGGGFEQTLLQVA